MTAASIRDAAAAHHGAPALAADNGNNAAESLARSHLLRLQAAELVAGARLRVGADGAADAEACWAPAARAYLKRVRSVLDGLGPAPLGPAAARLPDGRLRVPLLSDKFTKSLADGAGDAGANPLTAWSFPFAGGSSLSLSPVGSFGHAGNAGLAGRHANGNVVPTLDVAVLVRPGGKEGEAFAGGKDYLNHSYTDVSAPENIRIFVIGSVSNSLRCSTHPLVTFRRNGTSSPFTWRRSSRGNTIAPTSGRCT